MSTALILSPALELVPAPLFAPTPKAAQRVVEFFTAQINNDHTRKAYLNTDIHFDVAWVFTHVRGTRRNITAGGTRARRKTRVLM